MARRCDEETTRFFQRDEYDPRFCFALFQRAVKQQDQVAWHRLYRCYQPLIVSWVKRHSTFPLSGESAPHFANLAFERLWRALAEDGIDRFDDLKSILKYLQLCVHSSLIDHARAAELETVQLELADYEAQPNDAYSNVEGSVSRRQLADQMWTYLEECFQDEAERLVMYCTFVLGQKPRQILEQHAKQFKEIGDVYRVKQNVLARLRRDPKMKAYLDE